MYGGIRLSRDITSHLLVRLSTFAEIVLTLQNQAIDRAHRFGQKQDVTIYKITIEDTIEERILVLQYIVTLSSECNPDPYVYMTGTRSKTSLTPHSMAEAENCKSSLSMVNDGGIAYVIHHPDGPFAYLQKSCICSDETSRGRCWGLQPLVSRRAKPKPF